MSLTIERPTSSPVDLAALGAAAPLLTAQDRCSSSSVSLDARGQKVPGRCGAQALMRATLPSGLDLIFCGHHANQVRAGLVASGAHLREQPSPE